MSWLELREAKGETLQAQVEGIVLMKGGWEESRFGLRMPLTAKLFTEEPVFQAEMAARKAPEKISEFLTWMLEGGEDPSDSILEWELISREARRKLTLGQRTEVFEWLAKNQDRTGQGRDQLFHFFNGVAGQPGAPLGIRAWSVYGMAHSGLLVIPEGEKQERIRRRIRQVLTDAQGVDPRLLERIHSILAGLPGISTTGEGAGMEEEWLVAEEAWETDWVGFPDRERVAEHAFVVTEEALLGDGSRPGIGFHVQKLFELIPDLSLRVVARDDEQAAWVRQALELPADQVTAPGEGQSYEDAVRGEIRRYQQEPKVVHLVHTARLNWGVDEIPLPASTEMWLENVSRIFRVLGFIGGAESLGVNHHTAARLASEVFADRLA